MFPSWIKVIELRRSGNLQVSITMSKRINGRLPARIGTGGKPFRYSLLAYTEFMTKLLPQTPRSHAPAWERLRTVMPL